MPNWALVNKYSSSLNVYSEIYSGTQIGTIYVNELYIAVPESPLNGYPYPQPFYGVATKIYFRNSSGQETYGYLHHPEGGQYPWKAQQGPYTMYPAGTVNLYGTTYYYYNVRRTEEIRKPDGTYSKSVQSGNKVATLSNQCGSTYIDYMYCNYIYNGSNWVPANDSGNYGYVNLGLEDGSEPNTISIYGNL
jgi:hypothetical protein